MVSIPWPLSTAPGHRAQEAAGRLINAYAEPLINVPGRTAIWRRMPGLKSWGTTSQTGPRGMLALPGVLYAGYSGRVMRFASAGGAGTLHGTLSGTAKCFWARNNNSTPDVVVVDPDNGASVVTSTTVANYPDSDVGQPNSVCSLGSYFFFTYGNGVCRASGINTTDINANDFVTAESNPDGLLRGIPYNGMLLLFGPNSLEFFSGAVVNDTGFPFNRVTATPHGLAGRYAIAGHEDGYGKALLWVGTDNRVNLLKGGYEPTAVSSPALDLLIAAVTDKDTLEASIHVIAGIPWWVLSSPAWTWAVNLNTLSTGVGWSERESWGVEDGQFTRWRGTQSHFAFGKWLIQDEQSGNVLEIDAATKKEVVSPLRFMVESLPVLKFPANIRVPRADFDMTTGVGIATGEEPNETDPQVEISFCVDGLNWSIPLLRSLGQQAKPRTRPFVRRCGLSMACGHRWRLVVTDPVDVALMGGEMQAKI